MSIDLRACSDFLTVFSDFIDGSLDPATTSEVLAHLDCCEGCLLHLRAYRRGVGTLRAAEPAPFDPDVEDDFYEKLEERLRRDAGWGYLEPVPAGAYGQPTRSSGLPAAGLAGLVILALVAGLSQMRQGGGRQGGGGDQAPVSIASVIPTVWMTRAVAGEAAPDASRAHVARSTVPGIGRGAPAPEPVPSIAVESLEDEFTRLQDVYAPIRGALGTWEKGPRWLDVPGGGISPAALVLDAALRLP